jgi:hypothetical protein
MQSLEFYTNLVIKFLLQHCAYEHKSFQVEPISNLPLFNYTLRASRNTRSIKLGIEYMHTSIVEVD